MSDNYLEIANSWLNGNFDVETKSEIKRLMSDKPKELEDSFYRNLEFGTGGLRGVMGVGTNRMNKYTVGMATQGLANYINKNFSDKEQISVAVSFDSRNLSKEFAKITADVFAANGFVVYFTNTDARCILCDVCVVSHDDCTYYNLFVIDIIGSYVFV